MSNKQQNTEKQMKNINENNETNNGEILTERVIQNTFLIFFVILYGVFFIMSPQKDLVTRASFGLLAGHILGVVGLYLLIARAIWRRSPLAFAALHLIVLSIPGLYVYGDQQASNSIFDSSDKNSGFTHTLSRSELYDVVKGCCNGSSGTYSPSAQDCILEWKNETAFTSCVGRGEVVYPNGNRYNFSGAQFVR